VHGTLQVGVEGLDLLPETQELTLAPHETVMVKVAVADGHANADNIYKLLATFNAGIDGSQRHAELMHVNFIAQRAIEIDGDLADWAGIVPQNGAQALGTSRTEQAYRPFLDWPEQRGGEMVRAWLAHDDRFFYFAARLPGMDGMIRFETRDDEAYFYPETVISKGSALTWPEGVRRFSYRKNFDIPSGNGKHNVQIAFNAIPPEDQDCLPFPPGTMPGFSVAFDTDYEFALNKVREEYGGGTEIFCLHRPGMMRKHFFPRQPEAEIDGGPVKGAARLVVKDNVVECALPWSVIPHVKTLRDAGQPVKFSFRVNHGSVAYELAAGRSVSKQNCLTFHDDWTTHWANEVEFGWEP
jgi:hypothetical protein